MKRELVIWTLLLAGLGALGGIGLARLVFSKMHLGLGRGKYAGGFPVWFGLWGLIYLPILKIPGEGVHLALAVTVLGIIGMLRDLRPDSRGTGFPGLVGAMIASAVLFPRPPGVSPFLGIMLTAGLPALTILCLKIASLVFEMPLILTLGTGTAFLLCFPQQAYCPDWLIAFTLLLVEVPFLLLVLFLKGDRRLLGDAGIFSLGGLVSGICLLGQSKALLLFGLLLPSMVVFFPVALVCGLILVSYFGNELYNPKKDRVALSFAWNLERDRTVAFAGMVFLCLNFFGLLMVVQASPTVFVILLFLFLLSLYGFAGRFIQPRIRTFPADTSASGGRLEVLGIPVDNLSKEEVLRRVGGWMANPKGLKHILTADSLAIERATQDRVFRGLARKADLIVPDGAGLVWAADFMGTPLAARIPGVGLVSDICSLAQERGKRVALVGSKPGIVELAVKNLREQFPRLEVTYSRDGFFSEGSDEEQRVIASIRKSGADALFVGMGVPRQETLIDRLRSEGVPIVAIGVGGSFDVISGTIPRAPDMMQRFALEWLYRLWMEPSRFRRMLGIPRFVIAILRRKWNARKK